MIATRASLSEARRIVIKVGSAVLTNGGIGLDADILSKLAAQVQSLREAGKEVALVSSGAVAAGVARLGTGQPRDIPSKQAAAAVGQSRLMHAYEEAFGKVDITVAQVLITGDDLGNRRRFLNARNTVGALFEMRVLPIFNENDTVVVEEIKVGDNDNLSALIASLIEADVLVLLTDIDALYTADPRANPRATRVAFVAEIDAAVQASAGGVGSATGTGGMVTKLEAARKAAAVGIPTLIARGTEPRVVERLLAGEDIGTLFKASKDRLASRKHWIAFTLKPLGKVLLDDGACAAVRGGGKSLLPSGIRKVEGRFGRGDSISICDSAGVEFARGLTEYTSEEIDKVRGRKTAEIESILGYKYTDEIVHRNDMVVLEKRS